MILDLFFVPSPPRFFLCFSTWYGNGPYFFTSSSETGFPNLSSLNSVIDSCTMSERNIVLKFLFERVCAEQTGPIFVDTNHRFFPFWGLIGRHRCFERRNHRSWRRSLCEFDEPIETLQTNTGFCVGAGWITRSDHTNVHEKWKNSAEFGVTECAVSMTIQATLPHLVEHFVSFIPNTRVSDHTSPLSSRIICAMDGTAHFIQKPMSHQYLWYRRDKGLPFRWGGWRGEWRRKWRGTGKWEKWTRREWKRTGWGTEDSWRRGVRIGNYWINACSISCQASPKQREVERWHGIVKPVWSLLSLGSDKPFNENVREGVKQVNETPNSVTKPSPKVMYQQHFSIE